MSLFCCILSQTPGRTPALGELNQPNHFFFSMPTSEQLMLLEKFPVETDLFLYKFKFISFDKWALGIHGQSCYIFLVILPFYLIIILNTPVPTLQHTVVPEISAFGLLFSLLYTFCLVHSHSFNCYLISDDRQIYSYR